MSSPKSKTTNPKEPLKRQLSLKSFTRVEKHSSDATVQVRKKSKLEATTPTSTTKRQQELIEREVKKMEMRWLSEQNHNKNESIAAKEESTAAKKEGTEVKAEENVTATKDKPLKRVVTSDRQPFLHESLQYKVEGRATHLTAAQEKVFAWVKTHCEIPTDFDSNHKFGPLSGISYEERVISAYMYKLIEPKNPSEMSQQIKMCTSCGEKGHFFPRCPQLG
jgi:hypothetical protein